MAAQVHLNKTVHKALMHAFREHFATGDSGLQKVATNRFGETSLRADYEAEQNILDVLRSHRIPITVVSEEHGRVVMGNKLLGILDGLDGTNRYVAYRQGDDSARYGTMFAVLDGSNPRYMDFLVGGIIEHAPPRLVFVEGGAGYVHDFMNSKESRLRTSGKRSVDGKTRVYVDYWEGQAPGTRQVVKETFIDRLPEGLGYACLRASEAHYVDLVTGQADLVMETTRKGNLEMGVAWGIVKAAGGVMVTLDGEPIGPRKFLHFGQEQLVPFIAAATKELADDAIATLKRAQRPA